MPKRASLRGFTGFASGLPAEGRGSPVLLEPGLARQPTPSSALGADAAPSFSHPKGARSEGECSWQVSDWGASPAPGASRQLEADFPLLKAVSVPATGRGLCNAPCF